MMAAHFATADEYATFAREAEAAYCYRFGDWEFNPVTQMAGGVHLTRNETVLLKCLIDALPRPLHGSQLELACEKVLGYEMTFDFAKVFVLRIRRKIGRERIATGSGGYSFVPFPEAK